MAHIEPNKGTDDGVFALLGGKSAKKPEPVKTIEPKPEEKPQGTFPWGEWVSIHNDFLFTEV